MAISSKKIRRSVTFTVANYERFEALRKHFGMPDTTLSTACDDIILDLCETFETAKAQGFFSIEDLFKVMGKQIQMHMDEIKEEQQNDKKKVSSTPAKQAKTKVA